MNQGGRRTLAIGLAVAVAASTTVVVLATSGGDDEPAAPRVAAPSERPVAARVLPPTNVEPPRLAPSPARPVPAPPEPAPPRDPKPRDTPGGRRARHPSPQEQQELERRVAELVGSQRPPSGDAFRDLTAPGTGDDPPVPRGNTGDGTGANPRPKRGPLATYGEMVVHGELDEAQVRRYVRRYVHQIEYCYLRRLLDVPSLAGASTVKLRIAPTGQVESASSSGLEAQLDACIADAFRSIPFPASKAGTDVLYTITFEDPAKPK